jgi:hypothetical protein
MKNIDDLTQKLNKYNFVFDRISDKEIQVKIMKNIHVQTIFNDDDTIIVKDVSKPGSILSGAVGSNLWLFLFLRC